MVLALWVLGCVEALGQCMSESSVGQVQLYRLEGVGVERTGALPWVLRMRTLGATQGVSFAVITVITVVGACNGDRKQLAESSWERESPHG